MLRIAIYARASTTDKGQDAEVGIHKDQFSERLIPWHNPENEEWLKNPLGPADRNCLALPEFQANSVLGGHSCAYDLCQPRPQDQRMWKILDHAEYIRNDDIFGPTVHQGYTRMLMMVSKFDSDRHRYSFYSFRHRHNDVAITDHSER